MMVVDIYTEWLYPSILSRNKQFIQIPIIIMNIKLNLAIQIKLTTSYTGLLVKKNIV